MHNDIDRALSALRAIPNNLHGDDWLRPSISAKMNGISFENWHDWCTGATNYKSEADCRSRWNSFDTKGKIQAGTLFYCASQHDWKESRAALSPVPPRAASSTFSDTGLNPEENPKEVYDRCEAATAEHPYLVSKGASGAPLDALRVVPADSALTIAGESMIEALVVPCLREDGSISSLQFIHGGSKADTLKTSGKPTKFNLPGASMDGYFIVGNLVTGGVVNVCEGIGAAAACWLATGCASAVCFGARYERVADALHRRDPTAQVTLVPDSGKEALVNGHSLKFPVKIAYMPEGWERNTDVNDLMQRDGVAVVKSMLEAATFVKDAPVNTTEVHPLAKFITLGSDIRPPSWVIPGFIDGAGVVAIAGETGIGKTTALIPLAMTAAGLHGDEALMPRHWRHVIYISEDTRQAQRIIAGITHFSVLDISQELVQQRIHLVEAVRLDAKSVAKVGDTYRHMFRRLVNGIEVLPLVVLDTKSAIISLDSENDNAEGAAMMAALKQGFSGLPVWLIGHVSKSNIGKNEVATLSNRGAFAVDCDGNQTLFFVREKDGRRYLAIGKERCSPKWKELEIQFHQAETTAIDEFGDEQEVKLAWGITVVPRTSRTEAAAISATNSAEAKIADLHQSIKDEVHEAWRVGKPLNRSEVKKAIGRNSNDASKAIENLVSESWLHEVEVPARDRTNNRRDRYLVCLTSEERDALLRGEGVPQEKTLVPDSWRKHSVDLAPEGKSLNEIRSDHALQ